VDTYLRRIVYEWLIYIVPSSCIFFLDNGFFFPLSPLVEVTANNSALLNNEKQNQVTEVRHLHQGRHVKSMILTSHDANETTTKSQFCSFSAIQNLRRSIAPTSPVLHMLRSNLPSSLIELECPIFR
jgi:hypothetical protein